MSRELGETRGNARTQASSGFLGVGRARPLRWAGRTRGIAPGDYLRSQLVDQIVGLSAQAAELFGKGVQALDSNVVVRHEQTRPGFDDKISVIESSTLQKNKLSSFDSTRRRDGILSSRVEVPTSGPGATVFASQKDVF